MKDVFTFYDNKKEPLHFDAIRIGLASPESIREWSYGEVKKPETINYRTFRPEKEGLFCAKIFGPIKDYECLCGKYKRMKHRGIVCEKCGVEVIQARVRRERLGHIELATPVAHVWFLRSLPSRIGNLLDIPLKELEQVLHCVSYMVLDPGDTPLQRGQTLSESKYYEYCEEYGWDSFEASMGAEALRELLKDLDIEQLADELRAEMRRATTEAKRKKITKRLKVVEAFRQSNNKPEWMILEVLPVLPPDLRPLVPLEGGRFATSDLNDLYRRVINRNNRLKRLIELSAPEIIIRNEKRMLQEAVDALFENGKGSKQITGPTKRPLKSLSEMIRGKQGRFRQNLLGKRVDYSGRSVIVVGPELRLHQCGLPKTMALELYKPFIYHKLEHLGYVSTIKSAKRLVEKGDDVVWDILEDVIREHPVLLNRAPTLHRLGIQAFEPLLIEGKAIQLHPLVCAAYNADFDGDQMAVHLPLSVEAQTEARVLMMSTNNVLSPANGKAVIGPSQDIVLGCYYMTRERRFAKGEGKRYSGPAEVIAAYDHGEAHLQAKVQVVMDGEMAETTVGRVLFAEILPKGMPFSLVNRTLKKKELSNLIDEAYKRCGEKATVLFADKMRTLGFTYAMRSGISVGLVDMVVPRRKAEILAQARAEVERVDEEVRQGATTSGERYNKVVDIWNDATERIAKEMMNDIKTDVVIGPDGQEVTQESFNSIYIMADSGARGSAQQIRQLAGMRGMMAKPSGEIIETPITANFREGLTALEYFISTHGARKGLADTALKTANSGYMTRRLVDVAQDATISELDCGTLDGLEVKALVEGGEVVQRLGERILGTVALEPVFDPNTDELIVDADEEITEDIVDRIEDAVIEMVRVRSPLTCQSVRGICAKCYGRDLARGRLVNVGEAVGIIAAQSIGEPGTQLTMRTFHFGGVSALQAQESSVEARHSGRIKYEKTRRVPTEGGKWVNMTRQGKLYIVDERGQTRDTAPLAYGARLHFDENAWVEQGTVLAEWDAYSVPILATTDGVVHFEDIIEGVTMEQTLEQNTFLMRQIIIESRDPNARPRIVIRPRDGKGSGSEFALPIGATVEVSPKDEVKPGHMLAKMPRESTKSKDITGGLPRVSELFEARKPKEPSVVSEIHGIVRMDMEKKGKRYVEVVPEVGEPRRYVIPKGKTVIVQNGDEVDAGEQLTDGSENPHDILRISGRKRLAAYLVDEIQHVYRLQGVRIHDKHIETIVRQMLRRVSIKDVGDTNFLLEQQVDRVHFDAENERVLAQGGQPARAEDLLLGITKAALATDSFISASSFQETTKVLTEAAIHGKVDYLRGLKENVIMGRLIPAGTGLDAYHHIELKLTPEGSVPEGVVEEGAATGS